MYVCTECGLRYDAGGYCGADGGPLAAIDDPLLGTEIGRYRIARVVGQGGMGRVYLGIQPSIGSRVALKVLSDHCARDPELLERFFAEARTVNLIRHEHIANVIDLAQLPDGRPYIVMEFVEGQTLARATRGGQAPLGGIVQVVTETLSALAAAHAHKIVHRDLKPDNVIVTHKGHAKVLDFGIAKLSPGLQHPLSPRTRTGALLGTPAYMAPEQISGAANVDARTDVYAAGVVLFEAITGTMPFSGATAFDLMRAQLEDAPPSVRDRRPDVPEAIARVITRALAKDPANRFQTAAEMSDALHAAAAELSGDQLRTLSTDRASLSPTVRRHTPSTAPSHTPPAFSAVNLPVETPRDATRPTANPTNRTREVAPLPARGTMWPWLGGAVGLAGLAVAVTVIVMSRDREPTTTIAPTAPVVTPTAPPPVVAVAPPPPTLVAPNTEKTAEARTDPDPIAPTAPASPPLTTRAPRTPTTPATPRSASPLQQTSRPEKASPQQHAAAEKASPQQHSAPPPPPPQAPPRPLTVAEQIGRGPTDEDRARAALAEKWGRHPESIALPHEHPIERRPRVVAAPRFDANNVDYRKVVSHALALARKELPGAHLTSIFLHIEDGRVNLSSSRGYPLQVEFGSGDKVDGMCNVTVEYRPRQVDVYLDPRGLSCNSQAIRVPRCSAQAVWERAGSPGAGKRTEVTSLKFNGETWEVGPERIPDDC